MWYSGKKESTLGHLQATWTPDARLFFWSEGGSLDQAVERELPAVAGATGRMTRRKLAAPTGRVTTAGYEVELLDALSLLSGLDVDQVVSDSVRCFAYAAKLALELAAAERVVPTVKQGKARWTALLTRDRDQKRFEALVEALPIHARCVPTQTRGAVRLPTRERTAQTFLDTAVDALYRTQAYPGSSRGWALEYARALRAKDATFQPREARNHSVPEALSAWSTQGARSSLRLGLRLELPRGEGPFVLHYDLHPANRASARVDLQDAWEAGETVRIAGEDHAHPASTAVVALARVVRIFPALRESLQGDRPRPVAWNAEQAWTFLKDGVQALEDAGFRVQLPEEFQGDGSRRIRARMRVKGVAGEISLDQLLSYTWEVVLGERILTGPQFADLLHHGAPIVPFEGSWVLLDPAEVSKLPKGLPQAGELSTATALRAVLTGQYQTVEVVADDQLDLMLQALRSPPPIAPPHGLSGTLRPYQGTGLSWLHTLGQLGLGACLADDMGLGKTVQLIAHLLLRQQTKARAPSLVICPTSVLGNWRREITKFAPGLQVARYHGPKRHKAPIDTADVVLTTYGLLVRDADVLAERTWDVVALDEAQAIKNPDSQRAKAAARLQSAHRVAMTGTPVENRLLELWSLMDFLVPGLLGPRGAFRRNVSVPVERFGDQEVALQLKLGVSPFLLRRLKTDPNIIDDLPDKIETVDFCTLKPSQAALYKEVGEEHLAMVKEADARDRRGAVLKMLTALKQICNHPVQFTKEYKERPVDLTGGSGKLERLMELLDDILVMGEKALIFTQYRVMGDLLKKHLFETYELDVPFLHGGVPPEGRDAMVDAFQEQWDLPFLLISLKAGGTGLNLTAASHVVHYDRWWNPAVEDQATDRAYRIGQRKNVHVHKMVSQGSLEERIDRMLETKRDLAVSVIGQGENWVAQLDDDALRALVMLGEDAIEEAE